MPAAQLYSLLDCNYRAIVEELPVAIYTCDMEGRITFYNDAAAELWGNRPELGKDLWCGSWKIYNPDGAQLELDNCPMAVTLRERRAVTGAEIVVERPDGIRINVLPHPKPIYNEQEEMIGAINMLIDITAKKEAEEIIRTSENKYRLLSQNLEITVDERTATLKTSEERYHKMIEEVQDYAILLLDKDGFILNWNQGAEKIKGYSEKEAIGKNFRIFYLQDDRKAKLPEKLIRAASEKGRAMHEGWRLRKDGTKFWGSIVITALHDTNGDIIGYSKVTRDLTEKKMAEDRLKEYMMELEFQNKQLEEYAHVASHDLQEPLRKIKTFANLLHRHLDDKDALLYNIEKINSSAERMESLIKDVLTYSQLTRTDELFSPTDLNKILENVKEDYELMIAQMKATIRHDHLPTIRAIPIQMQQLFSNLISNSLKFTGEHPIIDIACEIISDPDQTEYPELKRNTNHLRIIFRDNGSGFDPEYADQVFKLFHRLHNSKYGTGIGLAVCKKIVENHRGHISVSSEPGKGTVFEIILPMQ